MIPASVCPDAVLAVATVGSRGVAPAGGPSGPPATWGRLRSGGGPLVDANVLSDFVTTDRTVLSRVARRFGAVHVPRDVPDEVDPLDEAACLQLGLVVGDRTIEQRAEAGASRGRRFRKRCPHPNPAGGRFAPGRGGCGSSGPRSGGGEWRSGEHAGTPWCS